MLLIEGVLQSAAAAATSSGQKKAAHARVKTSNGDTVVATVEKKSPELLEPHTFAPQDLLALLRNLENEICMCEISLKDENDKQNKYKVKRVAFSGTFVLKEIKWTIFTILL